MVSFSSIKQYHAQLKEGRISCLKTVEHFLDEIQKNRKLNCFLEVFSNEAIEKARELDNSQVKGKLHGVVIGLKDNICYKDHKSSASSKILDSYISLYSATVVKKLLREDAIIIGRQNCDEFGMGSSNENSAYGPVLNPVNNSYVAGGSSGGSAAAVKAGLCMAALGSDTGGSVRLPADFCGIIGLKPTYGRVSRHGLIAYGSSFDQIGILANNIDDTLLILNVIAGPDEYDSTANQQELKEEAYTDTKKNIAYFPEWMNHLSVDPYIRSNITACIKKLEDQGHRLTPLQFPLTDYIVPAYYILTTAEASANLSRYDGIRYGPLSKKSAQNLMEFYKHNRSEGFGREVKKRIMLGSFVLSSGYYEAYFTKAQKVRKRLVEQTDLIFKEFDFILAPNSPVPPPLLNQLNKDPLSMYMADIFTVFANLTGIPAISLPFFKHSSNLPFGIQLMAKGDNELPLLRFSHQLMQQ